MNRNVLKLVLLVSSAHAMAHVYELSLPAVEQDLSSDYVHEDTPKKQEVQEEQLTGWLSTCWRIPWGVGALLVGWLVDRVGSSRMLAIYLFGCALVCAIISLHVVDIQVLFVLMFSMGSFASIYHPAGLTLISQTTTPANRTWALGIHGILGSAGIALAPLAAGVMFYVGINWPAYYLALTIPGLILGCLFFFRRRQIDQLVKESITSQQPPGPGVESVENKEVAWGSFFLLTLLAALQGMVYAGFLTFLRRDLSINPSENSSGTAVLDWSHILMALVLLCGCIGQYLAGRLAKHQRLESQLTFVCLGNTPFLIWMAYANDSTMVIAACLFSIVHFMNQPIYNSLIAKYTPNHRRSLCYGFSFMMGFGVGGLGALLAGMIGDETTKYLIFSLISFLAAVIGGTLWILNRQRQQALEEPFRS